MNYFNKLTLVSILIYRGFLTAWEDLEGDILTVDLRNSESGLWSPDIVQSFRL